MGRISQSTGAELEKAFREVLERFLPEAGFILDHNRIQCAGTQFGCDIKVEIRRSEAESHPMRILFECKNYDSTVLLTDILAKPFQAEIGREQIDLWVLISPQRSIANDADLCFPALQQKFSFPIVLLTPDEGIESLFALYEDAYQTIYGKPPPPIERQAVAARWQRWFKEQLSLPRHLQLLTKLFQVIDPEDIAAKRHHNQETFRRRARAFYRGKIPDWDDIASDLDVRRKDILQSLNEFITEATHGVSSAFLLSEAGAGKSTVLRRVALELARDGLTVLFTLQLPRGLNPIELHNEVDAILRRCGGRTVGICVDNAASALEALHYLCAHLQEAGQAVALIAADRAARWRAAMSLGEGFGIQERFPSERQLKLTLTSLRRPEVSNLIAALKRAEVSERIVQMDANVLQEEFISRFRGDLVVTLHEMIEGQDFDRIIRGEESEFRAHYPRHRLAYAITATIHQFGLEMPQSLLARLAGGGSDLQAEASFAELVAESKEDRLLLASRLLGRIATRHEVVAKAVYEGLPEGEQQVLFKGIVEGVDPANTVEVATVAALLISPDLRRELWSLPFAGKLYMAALKRLPAHPKLFHAALLYVTGRGDIDAARQVFQSTPMEYRTPAIIQDLGRAEQRKGNFAEARSLYRSGLGLSGQQVNTQTDFANLQSTLAQGIADVKLLTEYALFEYHAAPESTYPSALLRIAVEAGIDDAYLHHVLGRILTRQRDISGAISVYSEAEQRFPKSAVFFRLAVAELQPTPEVRAEFFRTAVEEGVADAALYTGYALLLKSMGQIREAREIFECGLQADPTDAPLYQAYALMEKGLGRITESRDLFERGLKADPTNAHLYLAYAEMEAKQKRWRRGLILLQRGIAATGGQNAPLFQVLGRVLAWLYRFDQAEAAFHQGLAIDPTHAPIFQEWAFVKSRKGEKQGVESVLREGCAKCPDDLLLCMTLAQFLVSSGRRDEAEPFMKRSLELCGKDRLRREKTQRYILQQPFRMGKPPTFHFVSLDQEGTIEQLVLIHPDGKAPYGFIMTPKGDRFYFYLPKDKVLPYGENDRVLYDLIEFPNRQTNRLAAIDVEVASDD